MHVCFWGVRGSLPAPGPETMEVGGNTSCVQVTGEDGTQLILDAGSGIRTLRPEELSEHKRVHIVLSHLHLDHIQGLLFFAPLFDSGAEITVWGPPGGTPLRRRLARYLSNPLSPVEITDLPAHVQFLDAPAHGWRVGSLELQAALIAHRGPTLGFRVSEGDRSLCYLPDHEPALGTDLASAPMDWVSGLGLACDVDALIHDAQYTDTEYASRRGWGHSSVSDALAFATRAQPGRMMLFHHDPSRDDASLRTLAQEAAGEAARLGVGPVELACERRSFNV